MSINVFERVYFLQWVCAYVCVCVCVCVCVRVCLSLCERVGTHALSLCVQSSNNELNGLVKMNGSSRYLRLVIFEIPDDPG